MNGRAMFWTNLQRWAAGHPWGGSYTRRLMMNNPVPRSFAELLAHSRDRAEWSRREIADAAGITPQFVAYLEAGPGAIPSGQAEGACPASC